MQEDEAKRVTIEDDRPMGLDVPDYNTLIKNG